MQLAHEPERERQGTQPSHAVLQRDDVVRDLAQIVGAALDRGTGLGREQLTERRLRPLDTARKDGLPADEGADEQVRIR